MRRRRDKWSYRESRRRRQVRRQRRAILFALLCIIVGVCFLVFQKNDVKKGTEYLEQAKYEEAIKSFEKVSDKEKYVDQAYRGMGIAYFELEEYENALQNFEKALEKNTEKTDTLYRFMGVCQMKLEKYEEAVQSFDAGLALEECDEVLRKEMAYNRVIASEKAGDWKKASAYAKEYVTAYPDDEEMKKEAEFLESR